MVGSLLSVIFTKELVFNWDHQVNIFIYNHKNYAILLHENWQLFFASLTTIGTLKFTVELKDTSSLSKVF